MPSRQIDGFRRVTHEMDVCVVGGGMAGMIAAIAAARHGAKTILVHDRPVLGGNASSEVRMWICGAHGTDNKETGLLEEIQLENCYRNPTQIYSLWDTVLYEKAAFCPNLTLLLNASCLGGRMDGERLESIDVWQSVSQTRHAIRSKFFIDCSGDSVLAPITRAPVRIGREASTEFDEDIEPPKSDERTMGNSLLIQLRETDAPQPYVPPSWAYRFEGLSDLPRRCQEARGDNFWWIEVGGLQDTIHDADNIRDELMKISLGVLDYVKNRHPKRSENENWTLEWMGSLPGKRESRRYVGVHTLTQNEIRDGGRFGDIVAYGGWSMDDHHPGGMLYPGYPTIYHPAPSPYGIPYRCLYSVAVPNLLFAGRNISVTHAALSSTRVMGTCSLLGQAAGTAAAICVGDSVEPGTLDVAKLQRTLMDDDQWLPGLLREATPLTQKAKMAEVLRDGHDRGDHAYTGPLGKPIELRWTENVDVRGLRIVLDSDLSKHKRMPCSFPLAGNRCQVPDTLVRSFAIEYQEPDGGWHTVHREENNYLRLLRFPLGVTAKALRLMPLKTWGSEEVRIFSIDVLDRTPAVYGKAPAAPRWSEKLLG